MPPDTLVALDRTAFRYSWFTLDGMLGRDAPFSRDAVVENFGGVGSIEGVLLSSDGSFFHVGGFAPSNTEIEGEFGDGSLGYRPIPDEIAQSDIRLGLVYNQGERELVLGRYPRYEGGYVEGSTGAKANPNHLGRWAEKHAEPLEILIFRDENESISRRPGPDYPVTGSAEA